MPLLTDHLFDLSQFDHRELFLEGEPPWKALERLESYVSEYVMERRHLDAGPYRRPYGDDLMEERGAWFEKPLWILIARGARIEPGAMITGPVVIDERAIIGHGARIRGPAVISRGAVVGHCSEIKNSILFPRAKAPHFNGVYDSIVGTDANLGAGVRFPNVHAFGKTIRIRPTETEPMIVPREDTGLKKFGALIGDGAFVGCYAQIQPGQVVAKGARVLK